MKLSKIDISLLTILFKSNKALEAFTIYKRLKLNYSDFTKSIENLIQKEFIQEEDSKYKITTAGKDKLLKYKNSYIVAESKVWREVPTKYLQSNIQTNDFYIPRRSLLDKKYFHV